jgi:hypothetical protein
VFITADDDTDEVAVGKAIIEALHHRLVSAAAGEYAGRVRCVLAQQWANAVVLLQSDGVHDDDGWCLRGGSESVSRIASIPCPVDVVAACEGLGLR